jgi:AcrR family transcriptional regulator
MAKASIRMSADERRESVVKAAIIEFARGGYASTSTAAIANRVGVSQPYLFRLFPDKRAIFLAAARRCTDEIRLRFAEVSDGLPPDKAGEAMADAYAELIADRDRLLFQMQMYVAAATAEQTGDAPFAAEVRAAWAQLWELVHLRLGSDDRTTEFMAAGMLINVLLAMGFPQDHPVWAGCRLTGEHPDRID